MNQQAPEKVTLRASGVLDVHSVFLTLQGEGPFAGRPAVFVRLYGCTLQCPGCDTDYTSRCRELNVPDLVNLIAVEKGSSQAKLVVFTGGEPMRQNLVPAVTALIAEGWQIQVETNGLHWLAGLPWNSRNFAVVCSPKTAEINEQVGNRLHAWKYIVHKDHVSVEDGLPLTSLGMAHPPARPPLHFKKSGIYVQPYDEGADYPLANVGHQQAAVASCMKYGYTLSLQTHKILGLP